MSSSGQEHDAEDDDDDQPPPRAQEMTDATRNTNGKGNRQCHDRNLNDPACEGKTKN
jgi:hypothetical protein